VSSEFSDQVFDRIPEDCHDGQKQGSDEPQHNANDTRAKSGTDVGMNG